MSPPAQPTDSDAVQGLSVSVTGEILVAAVVVTFFLFVIFLVLYLRANRYLGANPSLGESYPAGSAYAGARAGTNPSHPLAPALFKSIPIAAFSPADFKEGMECAVCLNEVAVGETIRTLPGCRHGFHLECIDMWFSSNSTCPICRCSLEAAKSKNAILGEAQQRGLSDSSVANRDLPPQEVVMMPSDDSVEGSSSSAGQGSRKPGRFLAIEIPVVALQNCGRVGFQRQMR